jgi:glutamine cyclotransferase
MASMAAVNKPIRRYIQAMLRFIVSILVLASLGGCTGSDPANGDGDGGRADSTDVGIPTYGYRIVNVFPHDPAAFTQGLVYRNGFLYEGTGGGVRATTFDALSSLRKVELETGVVLEQVTLDEQFFGEGIALLGDRVYQLTWKSQLGFVYALDGFAPVGEFSYATDGWGLTHDGEALIMSDGSARLYRRDPVTFEEIGRVEVRHDGRLLTNLNELEWIDGQVWANIFGSDIVARIDPASGAVAGWVDLRGLLTSRERQQTDVLNGIAYDAASQRLFVTGKLWPWLFEIRLIRK